MIQRRENIFVKLICRSRPTAVQEQRLLAKVVFLFGVEIGLLVFFLMHIATDKVYAGETKALKPKQ